jgi:hypothetical protein
VSAISLREENFLHIKRIPLSDGTTPNIPSFIGFDQPIFPGKIPGIFTSG